MTGFHVFFYENMVVLHGAFPMAWGCGGLALLYLN